MTTMNKRLQEFSSSEIIQAINANTIQSFETWSKWSKLQFHHDPEINWTESDVPFFPF